MDNMTNDSETQVKETLGNLLKRSRTKQSKTLEDASKVTKIHFNSLRALEDDNFSALPAEVFVRGFIKLYAEFLGLDPEDTIRHYISQVNTAPENPDEKPYERDVLTGATLANSTSFFRRNSRIITVIFLLAILLLFYGLGIFFRSSNTPDDFQPSLNISDLKNTETQPVDARQDDISLIEIKEKGDGSIIVEKTGQESQNPATLLEISPTEDQAASKEPEIKTEKNAGPETTPAEIPASVEIPDVIQLRPVQGSDLPRTVKVATNPPMADDQSDRTGEFKYILEARFNESSFVTIRVDDQPQRQYTSQAGIVRVWKAKKRIVLGLDNRNSVVLTLNGTVMNITNKEESTATILIPEDITADHQP